MKKNNKLSISLIIPCYNEESNLQKGVLDKIGNYVKEKTHFKEVIIVDDGSTDDTKKIIKSQYLPRFPKFKLIENPHLGKAFAVITGIKKAKGEYVMFMDFDLATPIEESEKLISSAKNGAEIIIGSRNTHREGAPFIRKLMAIGFIFIRNLIIGLKNIKDTQCGFKMFKRKSAEEILKKLQIYKKPQVIKGSSVSAGFDLEFLFVAQRLGYKIKEIPVTWRHVETKNVNFLKDSVETLKDILKLKLYDLLHKYN